VHTFIRLVIGVSLIAGALPASACDHCGCAGAGTMGGIFPQFHRRVAGLRFQNRIFDHPRTPFNFNGESRVDQDRLENIEFWSRLYPHPRVQLFVFVPYRIHTRTESARTTRIQGIGDAQAMANYMVFNTADSSNKALRHTLLLGGGLRIPTAKYQQRSENLAILPAPFQLGSGAYAFTAAANYTVKFRNWGVNADYQYRHHTTNELDYRFGAIQSLSANVFHRSENVAGRAILPYGGLALEHYGMDRSYGVERTETGGKLAVLNLGVDFFTNRMYFHCLVQMPLSQDIPEAQPSAMARISMGAAYLF
jgi:hypothetical protein